MWILTLALCVLKISGENSLSFDIATTWDSRPINHAPVRISLGREQNQSIPITVTGPFFNDSSVPNSKKGSFPGLWNYEVAEIFFLGDSGKYLEVEFGPYGHYILLLLNGERNCIKLGLEMEYEATIDQNTWTGRAQLPVSYLPPNVAKVNAYAIHGSEEKKNRTYEAMYGAPTGAFPNPDFHRLQYFREVNVKALLTSDNSQVSTVWTEALKSPSKC